MTKTSCSRTRYSDVTATTRRISLLPGAPLLYAPALPLGESVTRRLASSRRLRSVMPPRTRLVRAPPRIGACGTPAVVTARSNVRAASSESHLFFKRQAAVVAVEKDVWPLRTDILLNGATTAVVDVTAFASGSQHAAASFTHAMLNTSEAVSTSASAVASSFPVKTPLPEGVWRCKGDKREGRERKGESSQLHAPSWSVAPCEQLPRRLPEARAPQKCTAGAEKCDPVACLEVRSCTRLAVTRHWRRKYMRGASQIVSRIRMKCNGK